MILISATDVPYLDVAYTLGTLPTDTPAFAPFLVAIKIASFSLTSSISLSLPSIQSFVSPVTLTQFCNGIMISAFSKTPILISLSNFRVATELPPTTSKYTPAVVVLLTPFAL